MTDTPEPDVIHPEVVIDLDQLNRLQAEQLGFRVRKALANQTEPQEAVLQIVDMLNDDPRPQDEWPPGQQAFFMAALSGVVAQSSGFMSAIESNGPWMRKVMEALVQVGSPIGIELLDQILSLLPGRQFPDDENSGRIVVASLGKAARQSLYAIEERYADYAADQMLLDLFAYVTDTLSEWA